MVILRVDDQYFKRLRVLTLYSSTAGMLKLAIVSPCTALAASSQVRSAGETNCSRQTNLSVGLLSIFLA